jgi:hypothetical protein
VGTVAEEFRDGPRTPDPGPRIPDPGPRTSGIMMLTADIMTF